MKRFNLAASVLVAGALALAGCGSGGGDGKVAAPKLPKLTGTTVKVGIVGPFQKAAFGNPQPEILAAAQAAVDGINERGGIHGGKLVLVPCDDAYDPNKSADCGRTFVKDKVVAVVGSQTTGYSAYGPIVKRAGIPVIGALPLGEVDYQDSDNFPVSDGAIGLFAGDVAAAQLAGKKSVYMIGLSQAGGSAQAILVKNIAQGLGIDFKGYEALPTDSSDLSPAVRAAEKTGADVVIMSMDKATTQQFVTASESLGAKYTLAASLEQITPDVLQAGPDVTEGMLLASPFPPYNDTSYPGLAEYNKEMDAREKLGDKAAGDTNRQSALVTWVGFKAFDELTKLIKGPVTPAALQKTLKTAKGIDLGVGVTWNPSVHSNPLFPALTYTDAFFSTVKDGKVTLTTPKPVPVLGGH